MMDEQNGLLQKLQQLITGRKRAYQRTFNTEDANVDVRIVLTDLARFCRAHDSTYDPDPHIAAKLDGRREVWLRIQQHLELDSDTLWQLYRERMKQ